MMFASSKVPKIVRGPGMGFKFSVLEVVSVESYEPLRSAALRHIVTFGHLIE